MPVSMSVRALMCVVAFGFFGIRPTASAQERRADRSVDSMRAEADYLRARLARVNAEIALASHMNANFEQELAMVNHEVALADLDLRRAEDRAVWSKEMRKKGFVSAASQTADELTLTRVKLDARDARKKRADLEESVLKKASQELRGDLEKAKSAEAEKKSAFEKLQTRQDD